MHFSLSTEMMREVIMDHYQNPRNKREEKDPSYVSVYMDSVSCIDKIYIQMKVENNVLVDVCWHGSGCAISTASTSIMSELLMGKTIEEASKIMEHYTNMMYGKEYDPDLLDEAVVFMNTSRQPSRIKCATIGYRGVNKLINGDDGNDGE
ncbi:MAG: SUF system NifU family Fe-S cluster assembly protein [Erysipelotrichaceae bacterium]|nr:SUF system NifU family Fe-S cluster assembly protein [Erysipelotrichaceae bacterium]